MNKLAAPLAALVSAAFVAGCASSSGSAAAGGTSTAPTPSATSATSSTPSTGATSSPSGAPASRPDSSPGASEGPSKAPTQRVPDSATSALVSYLGPKAAKPVRVSKTVTGATYQRLADDLDALKAEPASTMECMVVTGENATVTITGGGHTWVYTVQGAGCRPVRVTEDGKQQALLTSSTTLLNQIRAIAGFTGMAHPLTG
jgi:hypothetical protein